MLYLVFMYIEHVPNRNSPPAILLRESYRDGKTVRKRTLANLSSLPAEVIEGLNRSSAPFVAPWMAASACRRS